MKKIPECFETTPIVYAVGRDYQIIVPVTKKTLMWAEIGGRRFYDDVNGIMRSNCTTHRIAVPQDVLNSAEKYKICYRIVNERKPYFSDVSDVFEYCSDFYAVKEEGARFYHIADAHNMVDEPVASARAFGDIDFLVLNGDLPNHSGDINNFTTIHRIAAEITSGEKPVVFSRGNHDLRGIYAENITDYTPTDNGRSYFTFRLGSIWGIVLDCGEDKADSNAEYGYTICCEDFRRRQTEYIKDVIARADREYAAKDVKTRLVVSHIPFSEQNSPPFDIEEETYSEWCSLFREYVKPDMMICGHVHHAYVNEVGSEYDALSPACTVVIGSAPGTSDATSLDKIGVKGVFIGAGCTVRDNGIEVSFVGDDAKEYKKFFVENTKK